MPKVKAPKVKEVKQPDIVDEEVAARNAADMLRKRSKSQGRASTNLASGGGDYSGTILG